MSLTHACAWFNVRLFFLYHRVHQNTKQLCADKILCWNMGHCARFQASSVFNSTVDYNSGRNTDVCLWFVFPFSCVAVCRSTHADPPARGLLLCLKNNIHKPGKREVLQYSGLQRVTCLKRFTLFCSENNGTKYLSVKHNYIFLKEKKAITCFGLWLKTVTRLNVGIEKIHF